MDHERAEQSRPAVKVSVLLIGEVAAMIRAAVGGSSLMVSRLNYCFNYGFSLRLSLSFR